MDTILNHPATLSVIVALPLFGVIAKFFGASFKTITKWYLYLAVFSIVIVMDSIFFPFIGGKDYFFRFTVELALICLVLWWAFEARAGELKALFMANVKKPLFIAVSAFAGAVLLACLFAYDMHAAFWSNFERGEGGFQMLHYYIFFVLLVLFMQSEKDWKNIFRFSLIASGLMIIYGLFANFQASGFIGAYTGIAVPAGWWHKLIDGRFQGSLGNPAYVAPYLMFSMFYAAYLWIKRKSSAHNVLVGVGYALLLAIFLFFFIISQTRGAFLGLGAGIFVLILYFVVAGRGSLRKWSASILLLLVLLGGLGYAVRNTNFVQNLPEGRLLQISLSDASAQTRLWVWGEAWKGFLERPVFGWGPENFTTVYDKYFDPRFFVPGQNTETWFDRAHSVFFDYLVETGIVGLLSYLAMFLVFAWDFFTKVKHKSQESTSMVLERGILLAMPVAYLVQGVAIFDVLPMYINLFLFLAFSLHFFYREQNHEHHG
jgi:O-antigen ligase